MEEIIELIAAARRVIGGAYFSIHLYGDHVFMAVTAETEANAAAIADRIGLLAPVRELSSRRPESWLKSELSDGNLTLRIYGPMVDSDHLTSEAAS